MTQSSVSFARRGVVLIAAMVLLTSLVGSARGAATAVSCSWVGTQLFVEADQSFDAARIVLSGTEIVVRHSNGSPVPCSGTPHAVADVTKIIFDDVSEEPIPQSFEIDLSGGPFADPGTPTDEIPFELELRSEDQLVITGSDGMDSFVLGDLGIDLKSECSDQDIDVTFAFNGEFPTIQINGRDGNDIFDGDGVPNACPAMARRVTSKTTINPYPSTITFYEGFAPNGSDTFGGGSSGADVVDYSDRPFGSVAVSMDDVANDGATSPPENDNVLTTVEFGDLPPPPPPPPPTTPPPSSPPPVTESPSPDPTETPPEGCDPELEVCGTDGDDEIEVTGDDMTIVTGNGDDTIDATGDNLTIICGAGSDEVTLEGSDGTVRCRGGDDHVFVDGDGNVVHGEGGDDTLIGAGANQSVAYFYRFFGVQQTAGGDFFFGGTGDDTILSGDGTDDVHGGYGRDLLKGGDQPDVINGGDLRDELRGGSGLDELFGGGGRDRCFGGKGKATAKACEFTQNTQQNTQ
jgi:Ca2+-binding RTX toxin-like protein